MRSLFKLIKQNRPWVILSLIVTFLAIGVELLWTLYVGKLADSIVERTGIALSFLLTMGLLLLGTGVFQYVNQMVNRYASERMAHTLRMNFADAVFSFDCSNSSISDYEAMSKVQNELVQSSEYMSNTLFDIVQMFLSGTFALVFLLFQNARLTVIILVPMIVIVFVVNTIGKKMIPLAKKSLDKKVEHNMISDSVITNFDTVLLFDAKDFFIDSYEKSLEEWAVVELKKERISAICNSFTGVLSQLPLLILFVAGAITIWKGYITIGMLIVLLNMIANLLRTLMNLTSWLVSIKNFLVHLERADIAGTLN